MTDDGVVRNPDQEIRHQLENLLNDPRFSDRIPIDDFEQTLDDFASIGASNTEEQNQALLTLILGGNFPQGPNNDGDITPVQATLSPDDPGPTFEELFQETLAEALGPDPNATFQNIFSDIFTGDVFSPYEQFVISQFDILQSQFITEARGFAEQGKPVPTFEDFLLGQKDTLEDKFEFTDPGASEALNQFIKGTGNFISTPFNQFLLRNFDRLFNDFIVVNDTAERRDADIAAANDRFGLDEFGVEDPDNVQADFGEFLSESEEALRTEFGFTFEGARQSFSDLQRLARGAGFAESPFERFLERDFSKIFGEFERSDPSIVGSFAEFVGQNEDRFRTEFNLKSPFERATGQISGPQIPRGKSPTRIQV